MAIEASITAKQKRSSGLRAVRHKAKQALKTDILEAMGPDEDPTRWDHLRGRIGNECRAGAVAANKLRARVRAILKGI